MKKFWNWKKTKTVNQETGQETEERILFMNGVIAEDSWFDDDVTPALFKDELNAGTGDITLVGIVLPQRRFLTCCRSIRGRLR